MQVTQTNNRFTIHYLTDDQLELLEEGLIHLQNALPKTSELKKQRHDCADMFLQMNVELVNSREHAEC